MMKHQLEERETIFLYNQKTSFCTVSTEDPVLIRRLESLRGRAEVVRCSELGEGYAEYSFPKSYIQIRPPRRLTEEQRDKQAKALQEARKSKKAI